jgi:esterase/lipase
MSAPVSSSNASSAPAAPAVASSASAVLYPSPQVLVHAAKLAMEQDKPIQLDYFSDSSNGKAYLGEDQETKEKLLVRSNEEFTSTIQKVYKLQDDFIIMTENSIYIVSAKISKRRIQSQTLRGF